MARFLIVKSLEIPFIAPREFIVNALAKKLESDTDADTATSNYYTLN